MDVFDHMYLIICMTEWVSVIAFLWLWAFDPFHCYRADKGQNRGCLRVLGGTGGTIRPKVHLLSWAIGKEGEGSYDFNISTEGVGVLP